MWGMNVIMGGGDVLRLVVWHKTNPWNKGLISADRNARIALMLTIPRSLVKSSTKDLSFPIFEIMFQRTHTRRLVTGVGAAIL